MCTGGTGDARGRGAELGHRLQAEGVGREGPSQRGLRKRVLSGLPEVGFVPRFLINDV